MAAVTDFLGYPDCMLCRDTGIVYYELPPAPYRWCGCAAGINRRAEDPGLVDRSNENVHKLGLQ